MSQIQNHRKFTAKLSANPFSILTALNHHKAFHIKCYRLSKSLKVKSKIRSKPSTTVLFTSWISTLNPALPLSTQKVGYRKGFALYQNRPLIQFKITTTFMPRKLIVWNRLCVSQIHSSELVGLDLGLIPRKYQLNNTISLVGSKP